MSKKSSTHNPTNAGRKLKVTRLTLKDLDARKDVKGGRQSPTTGNTQAPSCMPPCY